MTRRWTTFFAAVVLVASLACGGSTDTEFEAMLARAEQGDADAQFNLARMYDEGEGVSQDKAEALRWLRSAADQGNSSAQHNLGVKYNTGRGVPQDYAEALRWSRLAAEQGIADAQFNLARMYALGLGGPQDDAQAYKWFNLAASRSTGTVREDATVWRDIVANRLTPDQRAEAQRLAREWDEAHPRD